MARAKITMSKKSFSKIRSIPDLVLRSLENLDYWLCDPTMQKPLYRIEHILMYAYYCSQIPVPDRQDQQENRQDPESPAAGSQEKCLRKAIPGEPQEQIGSPAKPEILRCLMPKRKKVRGSYDRTGVWVSAAEKREEMENRRLYPKSSYGRTFRIW